MEKPKLTILRGLPGTGKSTFARLLATILGVLHVEKDMLCMKNGNYYWEKEQKEKNKNNFLNVVETIMAMECDIIVSGTFTTKKELEPILELAQRYGFEVEIKTTKKEYAVRSIHDVPEETIKKMRDEWEDIPGETIVEHF